MSFEFQEQEVPFSLTMFWSSTGILFGGVAIDRAAIEVVLL